MIKIITTILIGVLVLGSVLLLGFAFLFAASQVLNIDWQYLLMFAAFLLATLGALIGSLLTSI